MKYKLCILLMVLTVSATSAFAWGLFDDIGVGVGTGISGDGLAVSYNNTGVSYIYSQANGAFAVGNGNNVGIANAGGEYAVAYNASPAGYNQSFLWKGGLNGVGTTTADPFSTSASAYFWARGIAGDATQAYVAGSRLSGGLTQGGRWKAPSGSVSVYGQPSNFSNTNYYLYSASNSGIYAGWGRLSAAGTVSNKSQAMVLESGALVSLKNPWGAPSTSYYSCAFISPDAQTCFGYSGVSDNSTALPVYWNRGTAYTTSTTCNLIPLLDGYVKGYAMKSDATASVIAGWTIKASGEWGIDRRTLFLYDKTTGLVSDLRQVLTSKGVDLSGWGLMDITGISADGKTLTGTMLAADDTYWTTGTVSTAYHTWVATVPEPSSMVALATGLVGMLGVIRRKR